jgi:hypothetical protein
VVAQNDVLRDGERLHEAKVLVNHADPRFERVARRVEVHGHAVELDLAFVLPVQAGEDVGQGRLPRAVLAQ